MWSTSQAEITASFCTLVKSAILRRSSSGSGWIGAAEQRVGLDADLAQLLDRVLGRLGLDLARRGDVGHQRQVDVADVVAAELQAHLPDRLEERQRLDVAHRAADLDDRHLGVAGAALDEGLDLVGDVRDDLHRAAEVVAAGAPS